MAVNHGFAKGYAFTMAGGGTTAVVSLPEGFQRTYLQVSSLSSSTALDVYASVDGGTTYYQLRHYPPASSTVAAASFIVAASAMANGAMVPLPGGFKAYRLVATDSAPSAALTFTILGNT